VSAFGDQAFLVQDVEYGLNVGGVFGDVGVEIHRVGHVRDHLKQEWRQREQMSQFVTIWANFQDRDWLSFLDEIGHFLFGVDGALFLARIRSTW